MYERLRRPLKPFPKTISIARVSPLRVSAGFNIANCEGCVRKNCKGCLHNDKDNLSEFTFETLVVDNVALTDLINQEAEHVARVTNSPPKYLFIGVGKWKELSGVIHREPTAFSMDDAGYRGTFRGMKCIVIPWITGVFCTPAINVI